MGAIAKAVNAASTPHKDKTPPGLALVLFPKNKLDKETATAARKALGKVKGLAKGKGGKGSTVNVKQNYISARISGTEKVTTAIILAALKEAGVEASLTKPK